MFNYTTQTGLEVVDGDDNDATEVLKGSTTGLYTSVTGPSLTLKFKEQQPGTNVLMEIPSFTVTNTESVKIIVTGTNGDEDTVTVSVI